MFKLFCSRNKLAVVDENNTCLVYNIKNNELLFQVMFCFIIAHFLFDCILFKPFICTESTTNPCMKVNKDFKAKPLLTSVLQNSLSVLTHILAIPIQIKPRWAG